MDYTSATGCHTCSHGEMNVIWDGTIARNRVVPERVHGEASITEKQNDRYLAWLGRYTNWSLCQHIDRVGLHFKPGDYYVDLRTMKLLPEQLAQPHVYLRSGGNVYSSALSPARTSNADKPELVFDVTKIPEAKGTKVEIIAADATFADGREESIYSFSPREGHVFVSHDFPAQHGSIVWPANLLTPKARYKVHAMALDQNSKFIGLPSDPFLVEIK